MRNVLKGVRLCFVVFVLSVSAAGGAGTQGPLAPDDALKNGLNAFYNGDYEKADTFLDAHIVSRPDDPVGYWRKSYNWYFRLRMKQKTDFPKLDQRTLESFFLLVSSGIEKADAKIAANENRDFHLYVKACLLSIRGGLEAKNISWLTARSTMKEVIALASQSTYQDAKYLIGLTNYRGSEHSTIFFLAGLPRDGEKGLGYIFESVMMNNGPFVDDIWFVIFKIEIDKKNKDRFDRAGIDKLFAYLYSRYPENEVLQKYLKSKREKQQAPAAHRSGWAFYILRCIHSGNLTLLGVFVYNVSVVSKDKRPYLGRLVKDLLSVAKARQEAVFIK